MSKYCHRFLKKILAKFLNTDMKKRLLKKLSDMTQSVCDMTYFFI